VARPEPKSKVAQQQAVQVAGHRTATTATQKMETSSVSLQQMGNVQWRAVTAGA
tara:strand:- start:1154 stop:1315 length:162 start_codon:yes stop_codon:yes gene_type:complete